MTGFEILQIVTGCIGSLFFGVLFNIRGKKLVFATLGGFLAWAFFVVFKFITPDDALRYFFVAVMIAIYAEIFARILKTPTTTFIMTALIPLIPGGSLYYTMSALLEGNTSVFLAKAIYTISLAGALALGIVLTHAVVKMMTVFLEKRKKEASSD